MNIFEQASVFKLRFPSSKGGLTTEQLWDLPLQSKSGFDLDTVARQCNADLKTVTEESFVSTTINPAKCQLQLALDIVKHVIAAKVAENDANRNRAAKQAQKQKLLEILANKQEDGLKTLTVEEIQARIAALD